MKKHTEVYMKYFAYGMEDFMPCELLGVRANDVHHIENRGLGGTNKEEDIHNLMGLDRLVHLIYGDNKEHMQFLKDAHFQFMIKQEPYIRLNPYHQSFDELIGTGYEDLLLKCRRDIDYINKYKI